MQRNSNSKSILSALTPAKAAKKIVQAVNEISLPQLLLFMLSMYSAFAKADHDNECDPYDLDGFCMDIMFSYLATSLVNNTVVNTVQWAHARLAMYGDGLKVYDPVTGELSLPASVVAAFKLQNCAERCAHNATITYSPSIAYEGWNYARDLFNNKIPPFDSTGYYVTMVFAGSPGNFSEHVKLVNATTIPGVPATVMIDGQPVQLSNNMSDCFANLTEHLGSLWQEAQQTLIDSYETRTNSDVGRYVAAAAAFTVAGGMGLFIWQRHQRRGRTLEHTHEMTNLIDKDGSARDSGPTSIINRLI